MMTVFLGNSSRVNDRQEYWYDTCSGINMPVVIYVYVLRSVSLFFLCKLRWEMSLKPVFVRSVCFVCTVCVQPLVSRQWLPFIACDFSQLQNRSYRSKVLRSWQQLLLPKTLKCRTDFRKHVYTVRMARYKSTDMECLASYFTFLQDKHEHFTFDWRILVLFCHRDIIFMTI